MLGSEPGTTSSTVSATTAAGPSSLSTGVRSPITPSITPEVRSVAFAGARKRPTTDMSALARRAVTTVIATMHASVMSRPAAEKAVLRALLVTRSSKSTQAALVLASTAKIVAIALSKRTSLPPSSPTRMESCEATACHRSTRYTPATASRPSEVMTMSVCHTTLWGRAKRQHAIDRGVTDAERELLLSARSKLVPHSRRARVVLRAGSVGRDEHDHRQRTAQNPSRVMAASTGAAPAAATSRGEPRTNAEGTAARAPPSATAP